MSPVSPALPVSTWPEPRALLEDEWPALRTAVNDVFRSGGGDLTEECPLLFDPPNRANLRVIVRGRQDGAGPRVVAHAAFVTRDALVLRRRIRIACIGAVFTAPAERGQGLGSRVLADVLGRARSGADLVLCSGDRDLYRRQGLEPVPPLARFCLPGGATTAAGLDIRDASAADLIDMAALYDAEDVHFVRPLADWTRLWGAGRLVDAPATFSVVSRAGRMVAYIAAQRGGPRPDGSVRPRRILEVAGDRSAIVQAAPAVAEELLVPGYDTSTTGLCEKTGWVRTTRQFLVTAEALTADVLVIPWYGLNYL